MPPEKTAGKCNLCRKSVDSTAKNSHILAHLPATVKLFSCPHCSHRSNCKKTIYAHIRKLHSSEKRQNIQKNDDDPAILEAISRMERKCFGNPQFGSPQKRLRQRQEQKDICCRICKKQIGLRHFRQHVLGVHFKEVITNERPFACGHCKREFDYLLAVITHQKWVHGGLGTNILDRTKGYPNEIQKLYEKCLGRSESSKQSNVHGKTRIEENLFENLNSAEKNADHIDQNDNMEPEIYTCEFCDYSDQDQESVREHAAKVHSSELQEFRNRLSPELVDKNEEIIGENSDRDSDFEPIVLLERINPETICPKTETEEIKNVNCKGESSTQTDTDLMENSANSVAEDEQEKLRKSFEECKGLKRIISIQNEILFTVGLPESRKINLLQSLISLQAEILKSSA